MNKHFYPALINYTDIYLYFVILKSLTSWALRSIYVFKPPIHTQHNHSLSQSAEGGSSQLSVEINDGFLMVKSELIKDDGISAMPVEVVCWKNFADAIAKFYDPVIHADGQPGSVHGNYAQRAMKVSHVQSSWEQQVMAPLKRESTL